MFLDHIPGDRRVEQRDRVRRQVRELVDNLHDVPPHLVLRGLVSAARRLHQRIEAEDPVRSRRGTAP